MSSSHSSAFVSVGQNPDFSKVFKDILFNLDKTKYENIHNTGRSVDLLISELQEFLKNKRYFIVVDDIWEQEYWETIKQALVDNNNGSRIIITTHKIEVANQAHKVYELQPLLDDDSKKLFYLRLFGGEDKCPNNHPDDLSHRILKKCDGVPLAIITMASLLLGKSKKEWIEVCNSPGFCQDKNDRHMDNTLHILSLSYYDLPCHLKTCLLYLSVFPEDYLIHKDSLIWKWIAEGFVEKIQGRGLFEVGEEYFHDLINRSMIQGVDSEEVYGIMDSCRVHDMVLDLIVSISREENFVSVDGTLAQSHTHRLALKNRELYLTQDASVNLPQVRSFIFWQCAVVKWALHPWLNLVRLLALEHCTFREECQSLQHIGKLLHLRYLGIRNLWFEQLPEGIGSLKFLKALNLESVGYPELPCSIGRLTQLVCLHALNIRAPVGVIGKLISLEELTMGEHDTEESQRQFAKDLGNLCELRMLKITGSWSMDESMQIDLMQSLGNLRKMQHLTVENSICSVNMNAWDAAAPSQDLRSLFLPYMSFPKLPSWIKSAHLPSLSHLDISVLDMDEQGLKALAGLPELCYLRLYIEGTITSTIESDCSFQKLKSLVLADSIVQFIANEDSSATLTICHMQSEGVAIGRSRKEDYWAYILCSRVVPAAVMLPKLEELEFSVRLNVDSCDNLCLLYLPSLQRVKVHFEPFDASEDEVEREEAALRNAIELHPNRPTLRRSGDGFGYTTWMIPNDDVMMQDPTPRREGVSDAIQLV